MTEAPVRRGFLFEGFTLSEGNGGIANVYKETNNFAGFRAHSSATR